jgi:ribulose bisphosphate carboxylase small subunit
MEAQLGIALKDRDAAIANLRACRSDKERLYYRLREVDAPGAGDSIDDRIGGLYEDEDGHGD